MKSKICWILKESTKHEGSNLMAIFPEKPTEKKIIKIINSKYYSRISKEQANCIIINGFAELPKSIYEKIHLEEIEFNKK